MGGDTHEKHPQIPDYLDDTNIINYSLLYLIYAG